GPEKSSKKRAPSVNEAGSHPGPLRGKRVGITRAADQAADLASALERFGPIPLLFPVIRIAPPPAFPPLDTALGRLPGVDWILFSSQNAVHAVSGRCIELSLSPASLSCKVAAVGPIPADEASRSGFSVSHVASRPEGIALADDLPGLLRRQSVF